MRSTIFQGMIIKFLDDNRMLILRSNTFGFGYAEADLVESKLYKVFGFTAVEIQAIEKYLRTNKNQLQIMMNGIN